MPLWRKTSGGARQKCNRCGKDLIPVSAAPVGPDTAISVEATGETLCGSCMLAMMASLTGPADDDPRVRPFLDRAIADIARQAGLTPGDFAVSANVFAQSDVEIRDEDGKYQLTLCTLLMDDAARLRRSVEYVVGWIKEHPLQRPAWRVKRSPSRPLAGNQRFLFVFLPPGVAEPSDDFAPRLATQLLPKIAPGDLDWMLFPVPPGPEAVQKAAIGNAIKGWAETQSDQGTLRFESKTVKVRGVNVEFTCIIAHR